MGSGVCSAVLVMQKQTALLPVFSFFSQSTLMMVGPLKRNFSAGRLQNFSILYQWLFSLCCMNRIYISFVNSALLVINELIRIKKAVIHVMESGGVAAVPLTSAN